MSFELYVDKGFKFNAAHFIIHETSREKLHGHNYRATVRLEGRELGEDGYLLDFGVVKAHMRALCKRLDERFLCPYRSPHMEVLLDGKEVGGEGGVIFPGEGSTLQLHCKCDGARLQMPGSDAVLLPIRHSSAEEVSRFLANSLLSALNTLLTAAGIHHLTVGVIETERQEALYRVEVRGVEKEPGKEAGSGE